jgi:hypothetical protein
MGKKQSPAVPVVVIPTPPQLESDDEVWAHEDVRKFLKLDSVDQIKELTRKRTKRPLPCHRVGKYVRFKKSEVVRWFDEGLKAA